mgnify:CR=1 FL=1
MEKVSYIKLLRRLAMMLLAAMMLCSLGGCTSEDEPESGIDYYLGIQTKYYIYRIPGAIPPAPQEDMIGFLTSKMKIRIREVYPKRGLVGNDNAVLAACDEIYREYREIGYKTETKCVAVLYRADMSGTIVKRSTPIKRYSF